MPIGLCGVFRIIAFVLELNFFASSAGSKTQSALDAEFPSFFLKINKQELNMHYWDATCYRLNRDAQVITVWHFTNHTQLIPLVLFSWEGAPSRNRQWGQEQDTFLWQQQSSPGHCLSYPYTDHIACNAGSHTTGEFMAFSYTRTSVCMFGWKDLSLPAGLGHQLFPS